MTVVALVAVVIAYRELLLMIGRIILALIALIVVGGLAVFEVFILPLGILMAGLEWLRNQIVGPSPGPAKGRIEAGQVPSNPTDEPRR